MFKLCIFFILYLFSPLLFAAEVFTHIEKHRDNTWTVTYHVDTPINKLVFNRTPDNSRVKRWQPDNSHYEISFNKEIGQESISRKGGRPFTEVKIKLTPTYTPLPKEYAPFSPFSDEGMLLHSGRFFACASMCADNANAWPIAITAPFNHIIVNGKVHKNNVQWIGKDSGQKIYVGHEAPIEDTHFVSLIDGRLPPTLKKHIEKDLPKLMDFFADKMGTLDYRPALFASFSETNDGRYGHQGGTLSDQIFLHWYGEKAIEKVNSKSIFWFFAHEVAHLYQKQGSDIENPSEAWLHEGAAEFLAGVASANVANNTGLLSEKIVTAQRHCLEGLKQEPNYIRAVKSNSRLHYNCGLVLINEINIALIKEDKQLDIFNTWQSFNRQIKSGKPASVATFLNGIQSHLPSELINSVSLLSQSSEFDAYAFFQTLM
ncbi:hypothetical protein JF50_09855 [Pseudoalteromonas luteoviolacea]|uniref:Peptidase M1 membrane alanine aminopeptidase domain-containing protein n=1 Tax=Pseudoalteromonas luteoviolacea TaxID=43657 RepID=A0A0C1QA06_9GAMM|nr:hypothetical protein [Pseudoalteromonas luteoviolacea]KID57491.1 hypothetical protein JF50_09855 [Pseudoalteromonas luteoviolacea]